MSDLITYDDDLTEEFDPTYPSEYEVDRSWPYLAERGLSEAREDLRKMQDRAMSDAEYQATERAIEAIDFLFDKATYRDGFRYFSKED